MKQTIVTVAVFFLILFGLTGAIQNSVANSLKKHRTEVTTAFNNDQPVWCRTAIFSDIVIKILKQDGYYIDSGAIVGNDYKFDIVINCSKYKN